MLMLVSMVIMHAWFVTGLRYDIVCQRAVWYGNFYTTDAVLQVGVKIASKRFDALYQAVSKRSLLQSIDVSPLVSKQGRQAFIIVQKPADKTNDNAILLKALLYEKKQCIQQLSCMLSKKVVGSDNDRKQMRYMVSHFTLGAPV
jgi:hypothetical protein